MASKKLKIGVLFGGKSAEHEVSLMSAKNVIGALDKDKYQIIPVKIPKNGRFDFSLLKKVDVVFPVMHGPYGEDGSMQGLLKLLEVPFVGAGVLGSAVGMDKDVMKKLLKEANIKINYKYEIQKNYSWKHSEETKKKMSIMKKRLQEIAHESGERILEETLGKEKLLVLSSSKKPTMNILSLF